MFPQLFSEIAPNLFQGGTDDLDVIHLAVTNNRKRTDLPFDAIVTMYAWARPADWQVQEFRYGVPDASISDIDLSRLHQAVQFGYDRWKAGDRVLIRCQAGLNRSGLVLALILIKDGFTPEDAINLIRTHRGPDALFNRNFANWLMEDALHFLGMSPSQQVAQSRAITSKGALTMWLFTNTGFVSAVSNGKDLMVRSRDHESLELIAEVAGVEILNTPSNDYPYRVIISHEIFAKWVSHMAQGITYKNFKSEVAATRGYDFSHPLMKVWSAMREVEDAGAR